MLGASLFRYFSDNTDYETYGTIRQPELALIINPSKSDYLIESVDIKNLSKLDLIFSELQPAYVINCVGIIKQSSLSSEHATMIETNSLFPHLLAKLCDQNGARLIHFSTDCVFNGAQGNYVETDRSDTRDLYGRTKSLGEIDYGQHLTLRTSIIGHELRSSKSLIDWFLAQEGTVNGFSKAIFSGLPTVYVAELLHKYILGKDVFGLRHLSVPPINKYDLLQLVARSYSKKIEILEDDTMVIDRSLVSEKIRSELNIPKVRWPVLIEKMKNEKLKYF